MITTKEFHFDNYAECTLNRRKYEGNGYKITSYGATEDTWFFIAEGKN